MTKFLVLGANGCLGSEFRKKLGEQHYYCDLPECDVTNIESLHKYLSDKKDIECIINCAAGRDAEILEEDYDLAYNIAVKAIENLAECANHLNAMLIHFSSDYVFDGKKSTPYTETDTPHGLSVYGRTKIMGEQVALSKANKVIVFRIAWLLSKLGKKSFVNTMINYLSQGKDLSVVFDQVGSPTVAKDLVNYIIDGIYPQIQDKSHIQKLYHLTNEGVCSWYDISVFIKDNLQLPGSVKPIFSEEYPMKAQRPSYSVLSKKQVKQDFGLVLRHWTEGLKEILKS